MLPAFFQTILVQGRFHRRLARGRPAQGRRLPRRSRHGGTSELRSAALAALLLVGLLTVSAGVARAAQDGGQNAPAIRVTPSPQVFATLCALYAAGYPVVPDGVSPGLRQMVARLGALHDPTVTALRAFYRSHRSNSNADTLSRFVSFAMVVGAPPYFRYVLPKEELPPDVRELAGFRKLLREFYTEEHVDRLWNQVEPSYASEAARLRGPVSQVVLVAVAYSRRMSRFPEDRHFTVYVDPLVGGQTNFRIYGESYAIAVNPGSSETISDIRLSFLHFLLDPIAFNEPAIIKSKKYLFNVAIRAPHLPEEYKQNFVAFTDECLVRAVALRLSSLPASGRQAALDRNDRDGYVLVRPLYYGLEDYERLPITLAEYFPKLIESINVNAEASREERIVFAPASRPQPSPRDAGAGRIGQWMEEGNRQIAAQDGKGAAAAFERILQVDPKNARAQYGLAVASAMSGQGERARQLFEQVASSPAADPSTQAWSHVFLGRMNDLAGRRKDALVQYRAALAIAGVSAPVRAAAEQGIKNPFTVKKTDAGVKQHR
ncbi:MAG TPA: tetratricopeptide repeat protein [Patescibacteria group bacterium]|nr:tetratricopeptide repeat protein [Patescibacteria group bacterium]